MATDEAARLRAQIGAAITETRKRAGISQGALGDRVGVAQTTISRWERGAAEGTLTLDDLVRVEDALELPRGWLLVAGGYVPDVVTADEAINVDPNIVDPIDRHGMLMLYSAVRTRSAD